MNLYGYAGGDPINNSDPFGLCPPEDDNTADCEAGSSGWYANRLATGEGNAFLNTAGGLLATCGESIACTSVLAIGGAAGNAAARIGNALWKAASSTGNSSVIMGSATEARIAGRVWSGTRSNPIRAGHGAGDEIGQISANGRRVYRQPKPKSTGPNAGKKAANLERKAEDGSTTANVHLVIP